MSAPGILAASTSRDAVFRFTGVRVGNTVTKALKRCKLVAVSPSQRNCSTRCGSRATVSAVFWVSGSSARRRFSASSSSSDSSSPSNSNRRVNASRSGSDTLPPATRFITFKRDWASVIWPDKKASSPVSVLLRSVTRNAERRDSASTTAQGSARWSAPPLRASSRRIRRAQSSAPPRIQLACTRLRSLASTSTLRHCCHNAPAAKVATSATVSMAISRAAPRWQKVPPTRWVSPQGRSYLAPWLMICPHPV